MELIHKPSLSVDDKEACFVDVFPRTGDPVNDSWLLTSGGRADAAANGPQYVAFYSAVNDGKNSGNWGPPRQVRFGLSADL